MAVNDVNSFPHAGIRCAKIISDCALPLIQFTAYFWPGAARMMSNILAKLVLRLIRLAIG